MIMHKHEAEADLDGDGRSRNREQRTRKFLTSVAIAMAAFGIAGGQARAETISPAEARTIAEEAYIFLYPLVTMDITRRQATNVEPGTMAGFGPPNAFWHFKAFPDANFKAVVRPNFDTLYSSAWLDLSNGPVIVSAPNTHGRYYLLPMIDMWTDVFAVPGKRTSGTEAAHFAVVPQGWSGTLPDGVARIDAPTPSVWIIGRTQTNGPADYDAVHAIQAGYTITPLEDWGKEPKTPAAAAPDPSVDMKTPTLEQVNKMPPLKFFALGAELMKTHPPHVTDWSVVSRLGRIGIVPGKSFDPSTLDEEIQAALKKGAEDGLILMREKVPTIARVANGWQINSDTMGVYGNYYLKRAIVAMVGLGANQPEDAIYPLVVADSTGEALTGEHKYIIHFAKDELPPVDAFWSITMYDADGFQVSNPINRFAIGDRDALKFNNDGSLDIYIQNQNPGPDKESNWLPSPASGALGVTMRLYAPRPEVATGQWAPPPVRRAVSAAEGVSSGEGKE